MSCCNDSSSTSVAPEKPSSQSSTEPSQLQDEQSVARQTPQHASNKRGLLCSSQLEQDMVDVPLNDSQRRKVNDGYVWVDKPEPPTRSDFEVHPAILELAKTDPALAAYIKASQKARRLSKNK